MTHDPVSSERTVATGASRGGRGAHVVFGAVSVVAVLVLAALAIQVHRPASGPRPGQAAPGFTLQTFDGTSIDLAALRGGPVVVNFWASWCVTCAYEAADLERVWQDYRARGVTVIGVDYSDTGPAALAYLARHGVTYPNGPDRGSTITRRYGVAKVPETFVVDAAGRIVALRLRDRQSPAAKVAGAITANGAFTPGDLRDLLDRLTDPAGS